MAFTEIANSTSANPYDVNADFLHVAQGSVTPKTGAELEETTASSNIGSSTYRWNNAYFNGTISSDTITASTFVYITTINVTSPTTKIEITGLNGDNDKGYMIISNFCPASDSGTSYPWVRMYFNNDSNTSNYTSSIFQYYYQAGVSSLSSYSNIFIAPILANNNSEFNISYIRAKTGKKRTVYSSCAEVVYFPEMAGFYDDSSTTITSIIIESTTITIQSPSFVSIYKYGVA